MGFSFNATTVAPSEPRSPVPAGTYVARIIESALKPTRSGEMLALTYEIIEGQFARRRIWGNLNVKNQNVDAQTYAQRDLKDICVAVGMPNGFNDSSEIHNRPLRIRVTVKTDPQYGDKNEVKGYEGISGAIPSIMTTQMQTPAAANTAPARAAAPWAKAA